jgi:hypothetical protein
MGLQEHKRLNPVSAKKAEHAVTIAAHAEQEQEQKVESPAHEPSITPVKPEPQAPGLQFYEDRVPEKSREPEAPQAAPPSQEKEGQKLRFFEDKYRTLRLEHSRSVDR